MSFDPLWRASRISFTSGHQYVELYLRDRSFLVRQLRFETDSIEPGHVHIESPFVTFLFAHGKASRMAHRDCGRAKRSTGERTSTHLCCARVRSNSLIRLFSQTMLAQNEGRFWEALVALLERLRCHKSSCGRHRGQRRKEVPGSTLSFFFAAQHVVRDRPDRTRTREHWKPDFFRVPSPRRKLCMFPQEMTL